MSSLSLFVSEKDGVQKKKKKSNPLVYFHNHYHQALVSRDPGWNLGTYWFNVLNIREVQENSLKLLF